MILKARFSGMPQEMRKRHDVVGDRWPGRPDALIDDQIPGVAQPHVGSVGEAGQAHQNVKLVGWCPPACRDKLGVELRMATAPVGPRMGSLAKPSTSEEVKMLMVSGSSRRDLFADPPRSGSSSMRIMVGSSCPSMSSLRMLRLHGVIFEVSGDDVAVGIVGGCAAPDRSRESPGSGG